MVNMFNGATSFNQPLNNWDVSNVTNMENMFTDATSFDQSLGNWQLNENVGLYNLFENSGISDENYTMTLEGWANLATIPQNRDLGTVPAKYILGSQNARSILRNQNGWNISDEGVTITNPGNHTFVTRWDTRLDPSTPNELRLQIPADSAYNFTINWGDGTVDTYTANPGGDISHTYSTPGIKTVTIVGTFPYFLAGCYDGDQYNKLIDVVQWGTGQWVSFNTSFGGCTHLESFSATDVPDLSQVTDMSDMFGGATSFNGDLSAWDVSNVTEMTNMFSGAASFNGDISTWDVSSLGGMQSMFNGATSFNQNISDWNVSPRDLYDIFKNATNFNQDVSSWDVSGLVQLSGAFAGSGISTSNYTKLLLGWSIQTLPDDMYLDPVGGTYDDDLGEFTNLTTYCSFAQSARDVMTDIYNWSINDGGPVPCQTATYTAGDGGTLTGDTFQYIVDGQSGTAVTAVPATGYRFISWSDGSTANPRTDSNLTSSLSLTAMFEATSATGGATKVGVRAERLAKALEHMPVVGTIAAFIVAVRDFLNYLTENEDELESLTTAERTKVIIILRDILSFLLQRIPGL